MTVRMCRRTSVLTAADCMCLAQGVVGCHAPSTPIEIQRKAVLVSGLVQCRGFRPHLSLRRLKVSSSQAERLCGPATALSDLMAFLYSSAQSLCVQSYSIFAMSRMIPSIGQ